MGETQETAGEQPPPIPPAAALPPSPPGGQPWYSGPFPPPGIGPQREGTWRMIWRTGVKASVAAGCFGTGLTFALFLPLLVIIAIGAALGSGDGDDDGIDYDFVYGFEDSENRLLSIPVSGVIMGEEPDEESIFGDSGVVYGYEVKQQLVDAADDPDIDGVVLEFETPGGTIFGSQAIADGIRFYREQTGKPVLAFVAGISASGGMYGMAPADLILADHGSLLGSIGVTMGAFEYWDGVIATEGGLFGGGITTRNGIQYQPITAGRGKDVGAPYRPLTEEERTVLQKGVDNIYADFVRLVSEERDIPEATIRDTIGALIYDNQTAEELGLIDGTANRQDAYARLAELARLAPGDWQVVRDTEGDSIFAGWLAEGESDAVAQAVAAARPRICFAPHTALAYHGDPALLCYGE